MSAVDTARGRRELQDARAESRGLFFAAFVFSIFVNILALTGSLYMLQVYDRVLGSRSVETLVALSILVGFLFLMMGLLDYARGRVMARIAARFQAVLDRRVFSAVLRSETGKPGAEAAQTGLRDLETLHRFFGSPVLVAFFDIPWTPFFLGLIFFFHPWLGILAISGGALLVSITLANQWRTRQPSLRAAGMGQRAEKMANQMRDEAEAIESLGMRGATFDRWHQSRRMATDMGLTASDRAGSYTTATKTLRQVLQSAMLGLGAYVVLRGEMSAGAMIAGSILLGRALAPVELVIGQWELLQRSSKAWSNLSRLLSDMPPEIQRTPLPKPKARLEGQQVTVIPPGESQASLRLINFSLAPGQAMGVIGSSGSGKTTLARAITGVWRCAGGKIRLDGAALDQYDPDVLGQHIGYLPQRVTLFEGTIAENIARLSPQPDAKLVVDAAQKAAAHEMILKLPKGYDTPLAAAGGRLSGGQVQRIGLARALYGNPVILVLDEPNSNLDNEGSEALNRAIRQMKSEGRSVIIMAHRPAAIQECDVLLVLEGGIRRAFGPRDEVLQNMVKNAKQIQGATTQGGVT
ncbi:type I secretion system permease/ATPase [Tropicimonas sp. IMCC34043]|uniref:type I secretion system permease/ATPase n=1 Tax=Tropicimonas sp. IMCC34043 TaxID=2248760 RepID=UPI000E226C05|nr:type I secretion system permease/ATPase [Tropicimonas sp. IMCC34043]